MSCCCVATEEEDDPPPDSNSNWREKQAFVRRSIEREAMRSNIGDRDAVLIELARELRLTVNSVRILCGSDADWSCVSSSDAVQVHGTLNDLVDLLRVRRMCPSVSVPTEKNANAFCHDVALKLRQIDRLLEDKRF
jgi:hypothetical protein